MATASPGDTPAQPSAEELLRQREQLREWIARLDTSAPEAPPHIVDRVRDDYLERLARVNEALGQHADGLRAELGQAEAELEQAAAHHAALRDEAAELAIRQSVGELEAETARKRQASLQEEIAAVEATRDRLRDDVARLREVLAGIGGAEEPGIPARDPDAPPSPPAPSPAGHSDDLVVSHDSASWDMMSFGDLDIPAPTPAARGPEPEEDEEGLKVDLAFLEELDRKIADSFVPADREEVDADAGAEELGGEDSEVSTPPPPGRRCAECKYTNPIEAKYCEVCDADLL